MTGTKFKVFSNLAICSNYSITSYIKITLFYFFEKKNKGQLKMQGFNLPSHMLHNVIFPTETNFPIRSKYVFILYEVLAPGKGPTNSAHGDVLKQKNPRPPAALDAPYSVWICGYMDRLSP